MTCSAPAAATSSSWRPSAPRLAEIVGQELDVPAREVTRRRRRNRRGAANQVPQLRQRAIERSPRRQRRPKETPHQRRTCAALRSIAHPRYDDADGERRHTHEEAEQHEPGNRRRQCRRRKQRVEPPPERCPQRGARVVQTDEGEQEAGDADQNGEAEQGQRN